MKISKLETSSPVAWGAGTSRTLTNIEIEESPTGVTVFNANKFDTFIPWSNVNYMIRDHLKSVKKVAALKE